MLSLVIPLGNLYLKFLSAGLPFYPGLPLYLFILTPAAMCGTGPLCDERMKFDESYNILI